MIFMFDYCQPNWTRFDHNKSPKFCFVSFASPCVLRLQILRFRLNYELARPPLLPPRQNVNKCKCVCLMVIHANSKIYRISPLQKDEHKSCSHHISVIAANAFQKVLIQDPGAYVYRIAHILCEQSGTAWGIYWSGTCSFVSCIVSFFYFCSLYLAPARNWRQSNKMITVYDWNHPFGIIILILLHLHMFSNHGMARRVVCCTHFNKREQIFATTQWMNGRPITYLPLDYQWNFIYVRKFFEEKHMQNKKMRICIGEINFN